MQLLNIDMQAPNTTWLEQKLADSDQYDLCLEFEPYMISSLSQWRDALMEVASRTDNDFVRNRAWKAIPVIRDILKSWYVAKATKDSRRTVRANNVVHNSVVRWDYAREWYLIRF